MIKLTPEQQKIAIAYAVKVGMTEEEAREMLAFYLEKQLQKNLTSYIL